MKRRFKIILAKEHAGQFRIVKLTTKSFGVDERRAEDFKWLCCAATASPREGRFHQTTSCAANFSSARSTTHNWGILRLGIVRPIRRSCGHAEPESNASQQRIGIPDRGQVLRL